MENSEIEWSFADISTRLDERYWYRWESTAKTLADSAWELVALRKGGGNVMKTTPEWFKELIFGRVKGILNLFFVSPDEIVIFPQVNEGLSMIAKKKTGFAKTTPKAEKVITKILGERDFFENLPLAEKAILQIARSEMRRCGSWLLKIENDDGFFFIMPTSRLREAMFAMGFDQEKIDEMIILDEVSFGMEQAT